MKTASKKSTKAKRGEPGTLLGLRVPDKLETVRVILQPTYAQLGKLFNVSRQAVYLWKDHGTISESNYDRLCEANKLATYIHKKVEVVMGPNSSTFDDIIIGETISKLKLSNRKTIFESIIELPTNKLFEEGKKLADELVKRLEDDARERDVLSTKLRRYSVNEKMLRMRK